MINHYELEVTGKVQGVFYRASAKQKANELGLKGTVQNKLNGAVFINVEGPENQLQSFIQWCKQGPMLAKVSGVKVTNSPLMNYSSFDILSTE